MLPSTLHDVHLAADIHLPETKSKVHVKGESKIPTMEGQIRRIWLEPSNAPAFPPAIAAILSADLIVIGPGSIFTSILPNLLVPDLAEAVRASRAVKFYICNVATEPGETDDFTCGDHIHSIEKHVGGHLFDLVICNCVFEGSLPEDIKWVKAETALEEEYAIYQSGLADSENPVHHDSGKLAQAVMDLFYEKTGPLVS